MRSYIPPPMSLSDGWRTVILKTRGGLEDVRELAQQFCWLLSFLALREVSVRD